MRRAVAPRTLVFAAFLAAGAAASILPPSEDLAGRVLYEDKFESGLGRWQVANASGGFFARVAETQP